ncbi:peptidase inhibitor family I36 protein [Streptomyces sp. R-74717]|uniref:peptidase inhibitor family I36 protein n=1 Tax=Streptomyces sp. R-74717 TaxID=2969820 RepID=UPI0039B4A0C9
MVQVIKRRAKLRSPSRPAANRASEIGQKEGRTVINIRKRLAQAAVSVGGAVALLAGGMVTAPTASAVASECPRSFPHPSSPALCLFDAKGFEGRLLKFRDYGCQNLGPAWGFDNRAESYINNTYHRAVLYYGSNCTGTSVTAGAGSASSDLGNARNKISSIRIFR